MLPKAKMLQLTLPFHVFCWEKSRKVPPMLPGQETLHNKQLQSLPLLIKAVPAYEKSTLTPITINIPASPPAPRSIRAFRPSLSTVNIPTKVNIRFTLPVITILNSISETLYPAVGKYLLGIIEYHIYSAPLLEYCNNNTQNQ